ncbi:zinc-binding alcohol dehydrogenase family protein [Phycisphaeraceae bacterium D3-23]
MKAIVLEQPKRFRMTDVEAPAAPGLGQALVRTHRMGICGTDIGGYLGKMPFFSYPRIPGHELGVEVIAVGDGVTNVNPGDKCSVEPYMNCGACFACRHGGYNCCENLKVIGVMEDGGLREQFLVRATKLHPSATLTYDQLALVETLAIGCHAADRGAPAPGEHVLIIGAGPIGLATLEFVRLAGATITLMDMNASRLDFCRKTYGIKHTVQFKDDDDAKNQLRTITGGAGHALVIDATGNHQAMSAALAHVAHTGRLVYVGITTSDIAFPHPALHKPEITLLASRNAMPADFTRIIQLIEAGEISTEPWITHRVGFEALPDEFERVTHPDAGAIKAIVELT